MPESRSIKSIVLSTVLCITACTILAQAQTVNRTAQDAAGAIMDRNAAKLQSLLQAGLDPSSKTFNGPPLLDWAASSRNLVATKMLLDAGANPNQTDNAGVTPLMHSGGCAECFALLLAHGADPTMRDKRGATAISYIASMSQGPDASAVVGPPTQTEDNLLSMIQKLLAAHADLNAHAPGELSALGDAIVSGNDRVAELLVRAGAHANDVDRYGATPLILASARGEAQVVEQLIKAGANINGRDIHGLSALDEASLMGNQDSAHALRQTGAKNASGCDGSDAPSDLQQALRFYLCSQSVQIVYRGNFGQTGMEFVVAGVPTNCSSISIFDSDAPKTGQILKRLVVLRKTAGGWSREFSQDYFGKNSGYILAGFLVGSGAMSRLVPSAKTIQQDYKQGFHFLVRRFLQGERLTGFLQMGF